MPGKSKTLSSAMQIPTTADVFKTQKISFSVICLPSPTNGGSFSTHLSHPARFSCLYTGVRSSLLRNYRTISPKRIDSHGSCTRPATRQQNASMFFLSERKIRRLLNHPPPLFKVKCKLYPKKCESCQKEKECLSILYNIS